MTIKNEDSSSPALKRLLDQLELNQVDVDTYEGPPGEGWHRLFGGHVAAQAVLAAYRTVQEGAIHSLHAYFVRAGTHEEPIRYVVHRIREGRTFTTRDVVAYQSDKAIFNLSCSFAKPEVGVTRGPEPPKMPGPDGLEPWGFPFPMPDAERDRIASFERDSAIEMRSVDSVEPPPDDMPRRRVWMGLRGVPPESPAIHAALLTYASDRGFVATAFVGSANQRQWRGGPGLSASLDHSIWFHRSPHFNDWLLFTSESPVAHAARALIYGQIYRRDGVQVATVVQEALIRQPKD